uniref:Putative tnf receptor-associated factor ovary overexpressed n=1 Tax=Rhipicephalus microplus TaxID=6941 RepID=A0A6M2D3U9_RHIMP
MSIPTTRWKRTVHGFGSHVEMRAVEFVDNLENHHSCFWCSLVSSKMSQLQCRHVICDLCTIKYGTVLSRRNDLFYYGITCCAYRASNCWLTPEYLRSGDKLVRCVNAGCDFEGCLKDLNEHLRRTCALYSTTCCKCEERFAYKDMRKHFTACGGDAGVFLRSVDVRSLLDNLNVALEKFEQAVASTRPEDRSALRDTVGLVNEQSTRIQEQLGRGVPAFMPVNRLPRLDQ